MHLQRLDDRGNGAAMKKTRKIPPKKSRKVLTKAPQLPVEEWHANIQEWLKVSTVLRDATALLAEIPALKATAENKAGAFREATWIRLKDHGDPVLQRTEMGKADAEGWQLPEWEELRRIEAVYAKAQEAGQTLLTATTHKLTCGLLRYPSYGFLLEWITSHMIQDQMVNSGQFGNPGYPDAYANQGQVINVMRNLRRALHSRDALLIVDMIESMIAETGRLGLNLPALRRAAERGKRMSPQAADMLELINYAERLELVNAELLKANKPFTPEQARLIAAAPELLAELKYLRNYARIIDIGDDTTARIDVLIAKAEGRS